MNAERLAKKIVNKVHPLGGKHRWREIAEVIRKAKLTAKVE